MLLRRYLSHAAQRGFAWGEQDCILFAAGWAREVCGRDPAAAWRGQYRNEQSGMACLERAGGMATAIHAALTDCGWRRVHTEKIRHGDIVLADLPAHDAPQAAGIAVGRGRIALLTRRGLVVAPVTITRAWRHG